MHAYRLVLSGSLNLDSANIYCKIPVLSSIAHVFRSNLVLSSAGLLSARYMLDLTLTCDLNGPSLKHMHTSRRTTTETITNTNTTPPTTPPAIDATGTAAEVGGCESHDLVSLLRLSVMIVSRK